MQIFITRNILVVTKNRNTLLRKKNSERNKTVIHTTIVFDQAKKNHIFVPIIIDLSR